LLAFLGREIDTPKVCLWQQSLDASLHLGRVNLLDPADSKLCFLDSTLQDDDFLPASTESETAGRAPDVWSQRVSELRGTNIATFTGTPFFAVVFGVVQALVEIIVSMRDRKKVTGVIKAIFRSALNTGFDNAISDRRLRHPKRSSASCIAWRSGWQPLARLLACAPRP